MPTDPWVSRAINLGNDSFLSSSSLLPPPPLLLVFTTVACAEKKASDLKAFQTAAVPSDASHPFPSLFNTPSFQDHTHTALPLHCGGEHRHQHALPLPSPFLLSLFFLPHLSLSLSLSLNREGLSLLQAKNSLADPGNALSDWNPLDSTPCNWTGVTCGSTSLAVTSLNLSGLALAGPFPSALCRLPHLSFLSLASNVLNDTLPSSSLLGCSSLVYLDLSQNFFVGPLPSSLPSILPTSYTSISSSTTFPATYRLLSLRILWLAGCNLVGPVPPDLGRISSLVNLDFAYNSLSGPIPESITELSSAVQIELYFNSLSGTLPRGLSNLTALRFFDASMNKLSGHLPEDIFLAPNLANLQLYENNLVGLIPQSISRCKNLADLHNFLSGEIPASICDGGVLSELLLLNNSFSGSLPQSLGRCTSLTRVRLPNNRLSGEVPPAFWGLPHVWLFELSGNFFSGSISPVISGAANLSMLLISDNQFSGPIPEEIGALSNLYEFSAANNMLSGPLPMGLRYLTKLGKLDLHNNSLSAWFYWRYRNLKKAALGMDNPKWKFTSFYKLGFSEEEILVSLDEDNVIGSGVSGQVYKVVLSNGETVAVKKLWGTSKKNDIVPSFGDCFEAEVEMLGKIRHKNIVKLWCCCTNIDSKLLVYEYMPNGSLGDQLHGAKGGLLDWRTRYKIALDAAEGLSYLHHDCLPPIVHRDVKSNNILLDAEFGAKVSDFGVAKAIVKGPKSMSVIAGSCGYIAPEYAYTLRVTEKSDIYSFWGGDSGIGHRKISYGS
ncbi:hypothetical protein C4D60_Mb01t01060 [Musa balbisiana]|uniref:Protein kinase domain-containing protein n=1 Tax=Musa balbisiana TaxID=52838 RepID=A0A4S8JK89_MUSBA|nr:hypothetical protein C4D60_Mb01t01060 [Musa balbisiana]